MTKSPSFQQKYGATRRNPGSAGNTNKSFMLNATSEAHLYYRIHSLETLAIQLKQTNLFAEELVQDH